MDWVPNISTMAQPSFVRASRAIGNRAAVPDALGRSPARVGSQGSTASAVSTAHAPMPQRQLPKACAIGTDRPAAAVEPMARQVV